MNSTAYSRKDLEEAKEGLKLLKSRMGGTAQRSFNNVSSHSQNRGGDGISSYSQSHLNSEKTQLARRTQYAGASANKPPMKPPINQSAQNLNHSNIESHNQSVLQGANQNTGNYRKAFKPNLNISSNNNSNNDSNDISPGIVNRQRLKENETHQYQPEKRSPNVPRRQLSTQKQSEQQSSNNMSGRGPVPNSYNNVHSQQQENQPPRYGGPGGNRGG